ncbi:hypothetical protein ACFSWD_09045 [Paenibacillus xanthanilyticus]
MCAVEFLPNLCLAAFIGVWIDRASKKHWMLESVVMQSIMLFIIYDDLARGLGIALLGAIRRFPCCGERQHSAVHGFPVQHHVERRTLKRKRSSFSLRTSNRRRCHAPPAAAEQKLSAFACSLKVVQL